MKLSTEQIELAMANRGIRKQDLARQMGMTPGGLSMLIRRSRNGSDFQPAVVHRLAKALNVKPSDLIEGAQP